MLLDMELNIFVFYRAVEQEQGRPLAGMLGAAFIVTGVFIGVNFGTLMPYLVGAQPD